MMEHITRTTEQEAELPIDYTAFHAPPGQGSAIWAFIAKTTPGDWLKIVSFLIAVWVGAAKLHTEITRLEDQATAATSAITELRIELGNVKAQLTALQVQMAANNALLMRLSEEQMEARHEEQIELRREHRERGGK
jgi:hypothetical protein